MKEQRDRAKADARAKKAGHADTSGYRELRDQGVTEFTGYDELATDSQVRGLLRDGAVAPCAEQGETVEVVLEQTPFYAESGGQIADAGLIVGRRREAEGARRPAAGQGPDRAHASRCSRASCSPGQDVHAEVDHEWRRLGLPGALRHARRARGAAPGARPERAAERFVQQARLPAARLRLAVGAGPGDPLARSRRSRTSPSGRTCRSRRST